MKRYNLFNIFSLIFILGIIASCEKDEVVNEEREETKVSFKKDVRVYDPSKRLFVDVTLSSPNKENLEYVASVYKDYELIAMTKSEKEEYFTQLKKLKPNDFLPEKTQSDPITNVDTHIDWSKLKEELQGTDKSEFMLVKKQDDKITWLPFLPTYGGMTTVNPSVDAVEFVNASLVSRFGQLYFTATANVLVYKRLVWFNGLDFGESFTYYDNNAIGGLFLGINSANWPAYYYNTNLQGQFSWGIN